MAMGKKLLVVLLLLCTRLVGVCWGQEMSALDYLGEGISAYEADQWQTCVDALEKAIAQGFSNPLYRLDALVSLGRAYARLGQRERALSYFKEVLKLQPDYRLDPDDSAGLKLFDELLKEETVVGAEVEGGGFPTGKIIVGFGGLAGIGALLILVSGGGGGEGSSQPDMGSIEGEVVLP